MKRLFLSSLFVNIFVRFLNVWTGVLSARFLGPYGRGELAAANRWSSLIVLLFTIGLPGAVIFYGKKERERQGEYITAYLVVGTLVGLAGFAVGELLVPELFYRQPIQLVQLAQIAMISVPFGILADGLIGTMLTLNQFGKVLRIRVLGEVGTFVLIILLVILHRYTVGYFITTNLAWSVLVFAYTVVLVLRSTKTDFSRLWENARALVAKGLHIYSAALVMMFGANLDQLVISVFLTPYILGLYAVAASIGGILPAVFSATLGNYLWPKLMDLSVHERRRKVETIHGVLVYSSLGASVLAGVCIPVLLPLVYGIRFTAAIPITEVMLTSAPIALGYVVLTYLLTTANSFTDITIAEVTGLICGVVVMLSLVHVLGGVGAAIGVLVATVAKWVYALMSCRKLGLSLKNLMRPYFGSYRSLLRAVTATRFRRGTVVE